MSLVWSLDSVTLVVMDGLVYYPFHFVEKKVWILNMLGRVAKSYELYARGICFIRGLHKKKIILRWNEYLLCSYMGPNQERIMDQMASRLSVWPQVSFIKKKTGTYIIGFCVYVSVVVRRFPTDDVFVYLQLTFWISLGLVWLSCQNMETTITSFKIAR